MTPNNSPLKAALLEYRAKVTELERENTELTRKLKVSEEIRIGEKKILIAEIGKKAELRRSVRQAVADYMSSEGCSCCRDCDAHDEHKKRLAKLLHVPMYSDKSGYNFSKFSTKNRVEALVAGKGGKGND